MGVRSLSFSLADVEAWELKEEMDESIEEGEEDKVVDPVAGSIRPDETALEWDRDDLARERDIKSEELARSMSTVATPPVP